MEFLLKAVKNIESLISLATQDIPILISIPLGLVIFILGIVMMRVTVDLIKAGPSVPLDAAEQGLNVKTWWNGSVPNPGNFGASHKVKAGLAGKIDKDGNPQWVVERAPTKSNLF